ncbi:MAG: hypothetical protein GEU90_05100 [Gemmatimonas sp.]|nr:hypothetical protein [Gemmatimonas sp.]
MRAVLLRAGLAGFALGVTAVSGSTFVLARSEAGTLNGSVVIATILLAFTIGLWAGAPEAARETIRLRQRWLSAAAACAVAGAFATTSTLYQQFYPGPWWRVGGLIVAVALPVYTLGLLTPHLLNWAERWLDRDEVDLGPWGGLGPVVIGGFTSVAAGALLAGFLLLPILTPGSLLVSASLLLLVPHLLRDPALGPAREREIHRTVTPYGSLRVADILYPGERQPERRLYLNGEEESGQLVRSGAPTLAYIAASETWLAETTKPGASYLFLGGGAYTLPRRIAERDPRAELTVVELDPEVTRIASRYFGLKPQHRVTTVHGDARSFLDHEGFGPFNRIYVDVYAGRESLPYSLVTREAAGALARKLGADGIAAVNLIGNLMGEERRQIWSVVRTFAEVFPEVVVYTHLGRDFPDRQNLLLALAHEPDRQLPHRAGYFEAWRRDEWPSLDGTTVFTDLRSPEPATEHAAPTAQKTG